MSTSQAERELIERCGGVAEQRAIATRALTADEYGRELLREQLGAGERASHE